MQLPLFEVITSGRARPIQKQPKVAVQRIATDQPQPNTIIDRVVDVLGAIDLDANSTATVVPAKRRLTAADSPLMQKWAGRVWLNPPTGRVISSWVAKLHDEYENGDVLAAIILLPARTNTQWWQKLANYPYCGIQGPVEYVKADGTHTKSSSANAVVYLGPQLSRFAQVFSAIGTIYIPYNG